MARRVVVVRRVTGIRRRFLRLVIGVFLPSLRCPDFEAVPGPAVTVMTRDSRALFVISDERHPWPTVLAKTSRPSYP